MDDNNVLFYEDKKETSIIWLWACLISCIIGAIFGLSYIIQENAAWLSNLPLALIFSVFCFLIFLYFRSKYLKVTTTELEVSLFFRKKVYKLKDLKKYECRPAGMTKYDYFILYFGKDICVFSILAKEEFSCLLNSIIEQNNITNND